MVEINLLCFIIGLIVASFDSDTTIQHVDHSAFNIASAFDRSRRIALFNVLTYYVCLLMVSSPELSPLHIYRDWSYA